MGLNMISLLVAISIKAQFENLIQISPLLGMICERETRGRQLNQGHP